MPFQLRDQIHWCNCAGRVVFLDLVGDHYFCLPHKANAAFLQLAAGDGGPAVTGPLQGLIARNILFEVTSQRAIRPPATIAPADGDYPLDVLGLAAIGAVVRALASEWRAAWSLRMRPFHKVIASAAIGWRPSNRSLSKLDRSARAIAAGACTAALVTRSHDRCLVRALAVNRLCRRQGISAQLVIGVIAHPFAAHCWVQHEGKVLVGGYEQARHYTPILVLE